MDLMKLPLEGQKLSCLQAKKRPDGEATEIWPVKRTKLERRKEAFVSVTAVNAFAKFVSFAAPSVENIENAHAVSARSLAATMDECESLQSEIQSEAERLMRTLEEAKQAQDFIETSQRRLQELPFNFRGSERDLKADEQALAQQLQELEQQAAILEARLETNGAELELVKKELTLVSNDERQRKEERLIMKESEGPQRERLALMSSFVQVKREIHEKLSGHHIMSIEEGKKVRVAIREDEDVSIDLEFDENNQLVTVVSSSLLTGTKKEAELNAEAISENRPASFVRGIKMLVHNAHSLEKELEELRKAAKNSKRPFEVEYNPSRRILLALFNRGSVYAKLRVPLDYTVSMVELIHLERPESSKSLKSVAQRVQETLTGRNQGKLVSDWVLELNEVL